MSELARVWAPALLSWNGYFGLSRGAEEGHAMLQEFVKPVTAMMSRLRSEPIDDCTPDEERRHQELLVASGRISR